MLSFGIVVDIGLGDSDVVARKNLEGGVKNLKNWVTSFMDSPLAIFDYLPNTDEVEVVVLVLTIESELLLLSLLFSVPTLLLLFLSLIIFFLIFFLTLMRIFSTDPDSETTGSFAL